MRKALISQGFSVRHLNRPQYLVGEGGFEPPKLKAADLQSVPFGHSGTLPYRMLNHYITLLGFVNPKLQLFIHFFAHHPKTEKFLLTPQQKLAILGLFQKNTRYCGSAGRAAHS